jgi:hypothetical protein
MMRLPTPMKLRKSHFEHDANARWSIPSLSWFAVQDHLGEGRIVGQKSGTKWQLFGPITATSSRSKSVRNKASEASRNWRGLSFVTSY